MTDESTIIQHRLPSEGADYLLLAGVNDAHLQELARQTGCRVILRGDHARRSFSCCYLRGDELIALDAVNQTKDFMAARKLIADRARFDLARLADPGIGLRESVA